MEERDLDMVRAWRNDRDVRESMFDRTLIQASEHARWFARQSRRKDVQLLLFERDGAACGYIGLDLDKEHSRAEWGFYTAPDAGSGTGREMGETVLARVFDQLGLHRLTGRVLETNVRSLRFHEKLGFIREGVLRDHHVIGTQRLSVHCFGLLENEWRTRLPDREPPSPG